jgi:hypothetical protein
VDSLTIPLAELLLEKMQIFQINEKDIIDTIMLLMEHPLGNSDHEVINIDRVAGCSPRIGPVAHDDDEPGQSAPDG